MAQILSIVTTLRGLQPKEKVLVALSAATVLSAVLVLTVTTTDMILSKDDRLLLQNQVDAVKFTVTNWLFPRRPNRRKHVVDDDPNRCFCCSIPLPGGADVLTKTPIPTDKCTIGYNIRRNTLFLTPEVAAASWKASNSEGGPLAIVSVSHFSINFADICIRWGLYESAIRNVGWPIVPGFDISGTITSFAGCPEGSPIPGGLKVGDKVFGCTLFGGYSSRVAVPALQLRKIPEGVGEHLAASIPAVALTAIHALVQAGLDPRVLTNPATPYLGSNRAILVHSAGGGVGSALLQMLKILKLGPVVAVVGGQNKVKYCKGLGADHVVFKEGKTDKAWWKECEAHSPGGFRAIFDANGVSTLQASYDHLAMTGSLVVYGFHSNIPMGRSSLSPLNWLGMLVGMLKMPRFDAMDMTLKSKSVSGFNLSFFEDEVETISSYMDLLLSWIETKQFVAFDAGVETIKFGEEGEGVAKAHDKIQSGKSVGKIVVSMV